MNALRPYGFRPAGPRAADKVSALVTVVLPRGPMDLRLRLSHYANGSPALTLEDADGGAFYAPTIAVCQAGVAELIPPELTGTIILAIKPSALRNGMANALLDAGILIDLAIEMPAERTWARLMQVAPQMFAPPPAADTICPTALELAPLPIPRGWERAAQRVRHAFARYGMEISDQDAMLAWAWHGHALQRTPPVLPPAGEVIVSQLRGYFAER